MPAKPQPRVPHVVWQKIAQNAFFGPKLGPARKESLLLEALQSTGQIGQWNPNKQMPCRHYPAEGQLRRPKAIFKNWPRGIPRQYYFLLDNIDFTAFLCSRGHYKSIDMRVWCNTDNPRGRRLHPSESGSIY